MTGVFERKNQSQKGLASRGWAVTIGLCALTLSMSLGSSTQVWANCEPVDYNSQPTSCFRKIPVYDQAETGICYSYAAAQMMDCYRFQHGESSSDLTNPIYAATVSAPNSSKNTGEAQSLYGGLPENVISSLKQTGSCPSAEVEKSLSVFKKDSGITDAGVLAQIEDALSMGSKARQGFQNQGSDPIRLLASCQLQPTTPVADLGDYRKVGARAVLQETFKGCSARLKPVNVPEPVTFDMGSDREIQAKLDHALNKNPVTLGVCSTFFDEPGYQGTKGLVAPSIRRGEKNLKPDCKGHAVVVSGRRNVGGRCQYLIRNSWGTSWQAPAAANCACYDLEGKYLENCNGVANVKEYVGCWFDAESMLKNTTQVTAFKD